MQPLFKKKVSLFFPFCNLLGDFKHILDVIRLYCMLQKGELLQVRVKPPLCKGGMSQKRQGGLSVLTYRPRKGELTAVTYNPSAKPTVCHLPLHKGGLFALRTEKASPLKRGGFVALCITF